jgi:hypothetical protein
MCVCIICMWLNFMIVRLWADEGMRFSWSAITIYRFKKMSTVITVNHIVMVIVNQKCQTCKTLHAFILYNTYMQKGEISQMVIFNWSMQVICVLFSDAYITATVSRRRHQYYLDIALADIVRLILTDLIIDRLL